jgi:hypothetical protein
MEQRRQNSGAAANRGDRQERSLQTHGEQRVRSGLRPRRPGRRAAACSNQSYRFEFLFDQSVQAFNGELASERRAYRSCHLSRLPLGRYLVHNQLQKPGQLHDLTVAPPDEIPRLDQPGTLCRSELACSGRSAPSSVRARSGHGRQRPSVARFVSRSAD